MSTNHNSLITIHFSTRAHADALHGLEELAFGLNGRSDDYLGLLKFRDVARADVAHAGGDRADKILAAIVDFGRRHRSA